ncbi:MAG: metallophosphoesterase [Ruminococcus sp.]|nr:metallophosphoesterase [Ruminococcus sp.]
MSLWITGDTHGGYDGLMGRLAANGVMPGDTVLITGDFGFVSDHPDDRISYLKLRREPFCFCFIDGNHEDHRLLSEYPASGWNGGKAQVIEQNIIRLMRGELYNIEGRTFFCMGGAYSHDKSCRREGYNWFAEEQPSPEQYAHADLTLEACCGRVDYILTHTAPLSVIHELGAVVYEQESVLDNYLEKLRNTVEFQRWFFGHYHTDRELSGGFTAVYDRMIKLF